MTEVATVDNPIADSGKFSKTAFISFLRAANITAYAAGDVISDSTDTAAVLPFKVGKSGKIQRVQVVMEETDTANLELYLFDAEPTNFIDGDALALVSADALKLVGVISLSDSGKKVLTAAGDGICAYKADLDTMGTGELPFTTADGKLYGLLVTRSVYTPVSAAKFHIRLQVEQDFR